MNTQQPYQFVIELRRQDGSALGQVPVTADWEPAWEAVRFLALRRRSRESLGRGAVAELQPSWHEEFGPPYVNGVDVVLRVPGTDELSCHVPNSFFNSLAREARLILTKRESLPEGERVAYLIAAFPKPPEAGEPPRSRARFEIEEVSATLHLKSSLLEDFKTRAAAIGGQNEEDIPVFIPESVLAEAEQLTRDAGGVETASVLLGHIHRDRLGGELFLEVTAQIPAVNSQATATKVSFGPETWNAVHSALALRSGDEQWVGWFHSHPAAFWCNPQCSPEARAQCPLQRSFFSADDCVVHRTVFCRAFHIALLVTNTDTGLQHALFSWRDGVIVQRGFHILGGRREENPAAAPVVAATIGEEENEKACS